MESIFYLRRFALRALEVGREPTSKSGSFGPKWDQKSHFFKCRNGV